MRLIRGLSTRPRPHHVISNDRGARCWTMATVSCSQTGREKLQWRSSITVMSVSVFAIYRHNITDYRGSTHFCKYNGHEWRSRESSTALSSISDRWNKDFLRSDFTPRNRVCVFDFNLNWWAGSKLYSLLSAHHLIGAYFLTTKSDKRMRLLTGLYGICFLKTAS